MAIPLLHEAADPAAELIEELRRARGRPDAALRRAVSSAALIAPAVIELVEKAADGVYLTPSQDSLLYWGIYVLGAGRRTELCRPLLRLVRGTDDEELHALFGDGLADTIKRVIISVFDGDIDALLATIADRSVADFARWGLLSAFTRLTFDGAIPRDLALQFLDRFEREPLAEPAEVAWEGWMEAVVYLGFEELHDSLRKAWHNDRMPREVSDLDHWEKQIAIVRAMRPGDPALLDRELSVSVIDPVEALNWLSSAAEVAKQDALPDDDPAAGILRSYERAWLKGFLLSEHVPDTAMTVEGIDGYFTALAVCPSDVEPDEYWPALWNYDAETEAEPSYDSDEQEEYVSDLLTRYMQAVKRRIAFGYPHPGSYSHADDDEEELNWVAGFLRGVALRARMWGERAEADENCMMLMGAIYILATGKVAGEEESFTPQERTAFFRKLPALLLNLYREWRGLDPVRPSRAASSMDDSGGLRRFGRKIGRNEPCPCGSGKKFKRCCGSTASTVT
jgi:yecA family protein